MSTQNRPVRLTVVVALAASCVLSGCAEEPAGDIVGSDTWGSIADASRPPEDAGGRDTGPRDAGGLDDASTPSDASTGDGSSNEADAVDGVASSDADTGNGTSDAAARDGSADTGADGTTDGRADGCMPDTCQQLNVACGLVADGCGDKLNCGTCGAGKTCSNNQCVCDPTTCSEAGAQCGTISDGCGSTRNCGGCIGNKTCSNNQCTCQPTTCANAGARCGTISDGCGGTLNCGTCGAGQTCSNNQCTCQPTTCAQAGAECGVIPDGCGSTLNCGTCSANESCSANACQLDRHTIFATSSTYTGNLGGLAGADSTCQSVATNAGLTGTWKAVLSTSTIDARNHISISAPIYNTNGDKIADNGTDLWNPPIEHPVEYDENGHAVRDNIWTGTDSTGHADPRTCSDWTTADYTINGLYGRYSATSGEWIGWQDTDCNGNRSLYCINGQ